MGKPFSFQCSMVAGKSSTTEQHLDFIYLLHVYMYVCVVCHVYMYVCEVSGVYMCNLCVGTFGGQRFWISWNWSCLIWVLGPKPMSPVKKR